MPPAPRPAPVLLPAAPKPANLCSIQALRAAAALAVVAYHAADIAVRAGAAPPAILAQGAAGVDVFFVVSGFVIMVSGSATGARPARRFLLARLRRIVPLYWLCSAVRLVAGLAAPALAQTWPHGVWFIAASFAFLPVHDRSGAFKPLLPVGWTLSYEMLFYALFAAALALRWPPARVLPPALAALVLGGLVLPPNHALHELTNPILLEFLAGTTLAASWLRGWRLPGPAAGLLLPASLLALCLPPKTAPALRALSWGIPAAALVTAALSLEQPAKSLLTGKTPWRLLPMLGDASYAIYLSHGFTLAALAAIPGIAAHPRWLLALGLPASAAAGYALHRLIERPLLRALRGKQEKLVLVLAGGGLTPVAGGVGTFLRALLEAWAAEADPPRLRIADTRGQGGLPAAARAYLAAVLLLLRLAATGELRLVHAHMTTRGSAWRKASFCWLAALLRVPLILHMHGADFAEFHARLGIFPRHLLNAALRRSGTLVVVSRAMQHYLIAQAGMPPGMIRLVPNGVKPRPPLPRPQTTAPRILFLGRLCARKGVPELLAALASPVLRDRPWHAVLAGDGDPAPFRAILNWHGLAAKVALPGWQNATQTDALLAAADILVLPSHHEAMPIAVLEALAAGLAVITTPVGAIPEFLQHGVHALLVPPGTAGALADAIARLLDDASLRDALGREGARLVGEHLTIGRAAARLAQLYENPRREARTRELHDAG